MRAGKKLGWPGATPPLTAFSRPKGQWGHSRPSPWNGVRVCPHAYTDVIDPECGAEGILNTERRKSRWQF